MGHCPYFVAKTLHLKIVYIKWDEKEDLPIRKSFAENSREYELDLSEEINVACPVSILHGVKDESIPYQVNIALIDETKDKNAIQILPFFGVVSSILDL